MEVIVISIFAMAFVYAGWCHYVNTRSYNTALTIRYAVAIHGFDSGDFGDVVSCADLLNMANDIEAGL